MSIAKSNRTNSFLSKWKDNLSLIFNHGGPGFCHFIITNRCDAHCRFCNFAVGNINPKDLRSISRDEGLLSIDMLYENGVRYIEFVGGEALLHKDILHFVSYAHQKGMTAMICTNGGKLTEDFILGLKKAGLDSMIISIDAPSEAIHEENRGIKDLCKKIRRANEILKKVNINTTASVTISKLISDYDKLPEFLKSMGFSSVTFSYPLDYLGSGYQGFSDSGLIKYNTEELIGIFDKINDLKKKFHIVNNKVSISEMQSFLRKEPQRFPCLGGYRYFFLDWNLDVYRCHFWEHPMCKIQDFAPDKFIRDHCNRCMIDCYRDASVLQHIAVSLTDAYQSIKAGRYRKAYSTMFTKNNVDCLKAVKEQFNWILKV